MTDLLSGVEPLRYADPVALVARAFEQLAPPERLTVSEAALRHMVLDNPGGGYSGPFTFDLAPFLRRPMDCLTPEAPYTTVAVMGPSQTYKSTIGDAWLLHTVICDPADMLILFPDKAIGVDYMTTQIGKLIRASAAAKAKQLLDRSADNIMRKMFVGATVFAVWPVKSQLRARPVPKTRVDDFDAVPEDIEGEGDALTLMEGRQTTFEGFAKTYVNSSPALGDQRGIEALVERGTDERWHVPCKACGDYFALVFDEVARFDRTDDPADARRSVCVVCPHCGGIHHQADKAALMRRGVWAGPEQSVSKKGKVEGAPRDVPVASFRFDGLMGARSWARLAEKCRLAELTFDRTQDEDELRAFYNTNVGANYRSRLQGAEPVTASELQERAEAAGWSLGTVPDWVRLLTAAVDVQANRFEVAVWGWGDGNQSALVDRFQILSIADPASGNQEAIDPFGRAEHWRVLIEQVIWRRYPVADRPGWSVPVLTTAIDTGGGPGTTDHAFEFWHTAVKLNIPPTAITLIKGGNNRNARALTATVDAKRQVKGQPEAALYVANVNRIKDTIDNRLRRVEPGNGFVHLPADVKEEHLKELTAEERRVDGTWERRERRQPNETWDLAVYGWVGLYRFTNGDPGIEAWAQASLKDGWALPAEKPATASKSIEMVARDGSRVSRRRARYERRRNAAWRG